MVENGIIVLSIADTLFQNEQELNLHIHSFSVLDNNFTTKKGQ